MVAPVGVLSTNHIAQKVDSDRLGWIGLQNDCPRDSLFSIEKGPVGMWTNKPTEHKPRCDKRL